MTQQQTDSANLKACHDAMQYIEAQLDIWSLVYAHTTGADCQLATQKMFDLNSEHDAILAARSNLVAQIAARSSMAAPEGVTP